MSERTGRMTTIPVRDVSLFVKIMGQGYPLVLRHGGPGLDYTTMLKAASDNLDLPEFFVHRYVR